MRLNLAHLLPIVESLLLRLIALALLTATCFFSGLTPVAGAIGTSCSLPPSPLDALTKSRSIVPRYSGVQVG
jgi:hypothetical protein